MTYFPQHFIDELLSRIDILNVIERFIPLKKEGDNHVACCPFHHEKTPSFKVSAKKQIYHCFGCGAGGNAIGFLMAYEKLSFPEATRALAEQIGLAVPNDAKKTNKQANELDYYTLLNQAATFYQQQLHNHPQSKPAMSYLEQRGLSPEIIKQFGLGYAAPGWTNVYRAFESQQTDLIKTGLLIQDEKGGFYDRFRDRIMFPIRDRQGRVIGFGGRVLKNDQPKYLNSPETPVFHKRQSLYGLYETCQSNHNLERLIVVEGYMDVIALFQHDINYAVATLGTATTSHHIERLFRLVPEVVFCFDGDLAGQKAAWRALEELLPILRDEWSIRFVFLPESEDPDTCIRREGKATFEQRIAEAMPLSTFFFNHLKKGIPTNTPDSRSKLAKLAMASIKTMPNNLMQVSMIRELAQLIQIDEKKLSTYLTPTAQSTTQNQFIPNQLQHLSQPSCIQLALLFLLQKPSLIHHIPDDIPVLTRTNMTLLQKIIQLLQEKPNLNTGNILEYFRGQAEMETLTHLSGETLLLPEDKLDIEFQAILDKFHQYALDENIESLMSKAAFEGLTDHERKQLQQLLHEKQC